MFIISRPKAFTDAHYIRNLPNRETEAITAKELAPLVGTAVSTTQKWLNTNINSGMVAYGRPGNMGVFTYYLVSGRPDNWVPNAVDIRGVRKPLDDWMIDILNSDTEFLSKAYMKPLVLAMLKTWIGACYDEGNFAEINQAERVKLQEARSTIKKTLESIDSFLNEPFLSGNKEEVSMAEDAIRAVSNNIDLDKVTDRYNDLTQL